MFLKKHFPQYAAACPGFVGLKWPMPSPAPRSHTVWQHLRLQPQGLPSALIQWHNGYTHSPAAHRHGPRFYLAATLTYHTEFEAFGFSAKLQNPLTAQQPLQTVKINFRQTFKRKRKSFWRSCQHSQLWHWQEEGFRRENPPQTIHLSSYATLCTNWHNLGRQEDRPTTAKYLRLVPRTSQDRMQSTLHTLPGRWFITGLQIIIQIKHAVPSILALFIIV